MTDPLKNSIQKNREAFEVEPQEGHFERFQLRLEAYPVKRKAFGKKSYLQIAAAILFVLLAGNQLRMYLAQEKDKPPTLSSVSQEYGEVEYYYTTAIGQGMSQWEKLLAQGLISPEDQNMMESEMKEFDETYARLQQELEASPEDERVVNAMLEVYQSRLSIITLIINKLETIKQQKKASHEKANI